MTLEAKTENAVIQFLSQDEELKAIGFSRHFSEDIKDGQIVVSAVRGEEISPPSGVFKIETSISLRMRVRRFGDVTTQFDNLAEKIEQLIFQPRLHEYLTRCQENFHCYDVSPSPSEREPQDGKYYETRFSLMIEAMPVTFQIAETLSARNPIPIS